MYYALHRCRLLLVHAIHPVPTICLFCKFFESCLRKPYLLSIDEENQGLLVVEQPQDITTSSRWGHPSESVRIVPNALKLTSPYTGTLF